ncbi:MAG TPA: immunoglobulin domain-containing protein [Candidatus Acidoferrales bacterium]|jgi:hypothetical protein|nr:immunoglobulin domain-containing protein [Candidatus Acidoferrales bacterium]
MNQKSRLTFVLIVGIVLTTLFASAAQKALRGNVPDVITKLVAKGRPSPTNQLSLSIGLPLPNEGALDEFIHQLYDPASTNFHRFITPPEFAARFGPSEADYQAAIQFATGSGLKIARTHTNRLVLDVEGSVADVEQAFHTTIHTYRHPSEARDFFAPDTEPSVPANLSVVSLEGLGDYDLPRPMVRKGDALKVRPLSFNGTGPNGEYAGNDFRNAYAPGTSLNGTGQAVGLLEFSDYFSVDIVNYENAIGLSNLVPVNKVVIGQHGPTTANNSEVSLDIEVAIAMAPGLSQVIVYEIKSVNPSSILSTMANDNLAKQLSSSWTWSGGPNATIDGIFKQMATQGQSYFQAAGDSDAYTGAQILDNASQVNSPVGSTNITAVGGTTLTMNGSGVSWSSEAVWNYNNAPPPNTITNEGSGGGICSSYRIPFWQTNISMAINNGSTTFRNVPDVALTADNIFVCYNNGDSGGSSYFMGTSAAAPLWAGFCALVNQQSMAVNGTTVGFVNPALYALAASPGYTTFFHDVTTGNNVGTNTPGLYNAVAGYDLATGLGTPNGTNLINALAPLAFPNFITQPSSRTVASGTSLSFGATATGQSPLTFQWLLNGTNLPAGGNISGTLTNVLTITSVTTNNAGNYRLVVTNALGSITSSVAVLTVGLPPVVQTQPTNLTLLTGGTAAFTAIATGTLPLNYQWKKVGTNLVNGAGITGATSNVLTLTGITTNSSGNYMLAVSSIFGATTSSVATLTVVLPPGITSSSVTNRTLECGSNISYSVTASGTAPLSIQWSFDAVPVFGATNSTFSLTNVHLPSHVVSVAVTNLYSSFTSNTALTINDTQAPVITLNGNSRLTNELGSVFTDPGATASDACAGAVAVTTNGVVNTAAVGTNTLTYKAADGNGNTNTVTRTVVIRDTTAPAISWSFTNLTVAADASCSALMTNVTGTNFVLATDLSGALTITQTPTNNAALQLGTNQVVITVADASGNKSFSTNRVIVLDLTPPSITLLGGSRLTNELGSAFADPGVFAGDTCAGAVALVTNGFVNIGVTGTNTLTYVATDGSGNTNFVTRTVVVRDSKPPTITWSFTNLALSLDTNCSAVMPDVTGTNFILATDLSGPLTNSQSVTAGSSLPLGTNIVIISIADAFGNTAFSTNQVVVSDTTPPVIIVQPQSRTNNAGETANFTVAATACTPIAFQWSFNNAVLTNQTNSLLTLSNVASVNAGNYFVVVSAGGGSTTSSVASLTVNYFTTALVLASSANPDGFKDNLSFTAVVTPTNAPGAVQFFTNGAAFDLEPLIAGLASSTNTSTLPRGTNLITAIYAGNGGFQPATNSLVQTVTNHPPQVSPAFYTLMAGLALNIAVTDLATNWSDVDGDALSIASVSPSTNGVVVTNGSILTYSDPNYVDDQFICTISDGFGGTNFATVNITIIPQTNSTPNIIGVAPAPGGLALRLSGGYGSTYVLESATNISSGTWSPVATNTLDATGIWQFTDGQVTNFPNRFYRLKLLP